VTPFAVFSPEVAAGAAAAAVGVPLLIHLLFRKRYQVVPWAAIRFLLVAERRHRRRIDQWLLLVLRVLALLLPLFAMVAATKWAEPLWQSIRPGAIEPPKAPQTHHVIVLDASLSMTARGENDKSRFEKAVEQAERLIESAQQGDGFTLLVLARGVEAIGDGVSNEPHLVRAELRKVKPTHEPSDTAAALPAVFDALGRGAAYPRQQVTFLTDRQRSGWANVVPRPDTDLSETAKKVFRRSDVDVVVVDLAAADADNLAVTDVKLRDALAFVDSPGVLTATITNHGRTEKRDVVVQLLVGRPDAPDKLAVVEQQPVKAIAGGGRWNLTFGQQGQIRFREKGLHVLQVKLLEHDVLPADDERAVALVVRDALRAVIVEGTPEPAGSGQGVWGLRRALLPKSESAAFTPARPRIITPDDLFDPVRGDLDNVDCLYLNDLPAPSAKLAAKLDAFLKRGGGVVIGLGPNSASPAGRAAYNRHLFNDGNGVLPGPIGDVVTVAGPNDPGFRLDAEEENYREPPLDFFLDEKVRGGLIMAPFRSYVRLEPPRNNPPTVPSPEPLPEGPARRVLSFVPAGSGDGARSDPALVEWTRHRGRVILFTSSFGEVWNDWPPLPSYLMFHQELLRYAAASPDRHTVRVGEAIEEFYPQVAKDEKPVAALTGPGSLSESLALTTHEGFGVAHFGETRSSGLYRLRVKNNPDRVFAVNLSESASGAGSESDLKRLADADFKTLNPVQLVTDARDAKPTPVRGAESAQEPRPKDHGPMLARVAVMFALLMLVAEMLVAWRMGPSRSAGAGTASGSARPADRKWYVRALTTAAALAPLAAVVFVLGTLAHYERTGELLGFLPQSTLQEVKTWAEVPKAPSGEEIRWGLKREAAFGGSGLTDTQIVTGLAVLGAVLALVVYRLERRVVAGFGRLVAPVLLRAAIFALALFVLLPQLKLTFPRVSLPVVVILIDNSGSMGTVEEFKNAAVRAKAEELFAKAEEVPALAEVPQEHRLKLAQTLLTHPDGDWLERLLKEKKVRVEIRVVSKDQHLLSTVQQPEDLKKAREKIRALQPTGDASRLGEGVESVLKAFRTRSLAAIIMFTDGVTTAGITLPQAAESLVPRAAAPDGEGPEARAAKAKVPLYLVGVGDPWERPDLEIADLRAEDTIPVGDQLVFDARVKARGQFPRGPVTVTLTEKGVPPEKARPATVTINLDPSGNREAGEFVVPVALAHTPKEPGEKTFILEVGTVEGETEKSNNRVERTVLVTDSKRLRVLYIEGYPRYDFRFAKVLLERESERSAGGKGVEVKVVLLGASQGWEKTDKSAYPTGMPTREELFGFDVVVLGDVDPKQLTRASGVFQNLADFVKVRGGGLMFLSGEHGTPAAYADTPLAEVLPVVPSATATPRNPDDATITEGFKPRLTRSGQQHPLFRFSPEDAESAAIWKRLQPLYWYAKDYRRKPNTLVLAEHPDVPAEGGAPGENHPLVIQTYAGTGPVLFLGFDDTWRWRFRNDEEYFDRFWAQSVRVLSQSRVRRVELFVEPKADFRRDEEMTVVVRFPVEAQPPGQTVHVQARWKSKPDPAKKDQERPPVKEGFSDLFLSRVPGPEVRYQAVLPAQLDDGYAERLYHFKLVDPGPQPGRSAPTAAARVLPPLHERERVGLNQSHLEKAAALSQDTPDKAGGRSQRTFYTLADAEKVFDDLKDLRPVPLKESRDPVELWNDPLVYLLVVLLLGSEWLLRKRERLL
jgi:hypothetical protein